MRFYIDPRYTQPPNWCKAFRNLLIGFFIGALLLVLSVMTLKAALEAVTH